jgi:hypothetical protein
VVGPANHVCPFRRVGDSLALSACHVMLHGLDPRFLYRVHPMSQ